MGDLLKKKNILSLFKSESKENAIIMDEIDGLTTGERGTLTELIKIMFPKKNQMKNNPEEYRYKKYNPFICISNSLDKKINEIKNKSINLNIKYPTFLQLEKFAKKILTKEKKDHNNVIIKDIVKKSQLDMRRLLTILEYIFNSKEFEFNYKKCKNLLDNFETKNIDNTNYECAENILNKYSNIDDIIDNYNNKNIISIIIYENFINKLINKKNKQYTEQDKYKDILNIYTNFVKGDIIDYNIYKNQNWDLNNFMLSLMCISPCLKSHFGLSQLKKSNYNLENYTPLNRCYQEKSAYNKNLIILKDKINGLKYNNCSQINQIIMDCILKPDGDFQYGVELINSYKISLIEFELMIRLSRHNSFFDYEKLYNNKKRKLKKIFKLHK